MYKLSFYLTEAEMSHSVGIYETREGALQKSEIRKNYLFFGVCGMLFGVFTSLMNIFLTEDMEFAPTEKTVIIASITAFFVVLFLVLAFLNIKKKKKSSEQMGALIVNYGFDQKDAKNAEFFEDRLVLTSSYKRYTEYYDEITYVISDRVNFTVVCRESGIFICIPKDGQDADKLFGIDKLLREKLGERFIYDMGGESNA